MNFPDENLSEKQRRVLEAAVEVFADKGFSAASTAEIAKRAGVAEGTVFKIYKTKKDLLLGVVAPLFIRAVAPFLLQEVRDLVRMPHATFEEFLRTMYTNRLRFVRAHERVVRIALQEVPFHHEVRDLAKKAVVHQIWPDVVSLVHRFQKSGDVRADVEPAQAVRLAMGTMMAYVVTRLLLAPEAKWDDDAEIELMVQTVSRGLRPMATPAVEVQIHRQKRSRRSKL